MTLKDEMFKTLYPSDSQPLPRWRYTSTAQTTRYIFALEMHNVQGRKSLPGNIHCGLHTFTKLKAEYRGTSWCLYLARGLPKCPKLNKLDLRTLFSSTSLFGQVTARTQNRFIRIGVRQALSTLF